MSDDEPQYRLIDTFSAVDVGQGYSLAWCMDVDGATWPVLYDTRQRAPQFFPHLPEHFRELAAHEMTGRMPDEFQQFTCGGRTAAGKSCRTIVPGPQDRCRFHPASRDVEDVAAPAVVVEATPEPLEAPARPKRRRRPEPQPETLFDDVDELEADVDEGPAR